MLREKDIEGHLKGENEEAAPEKTDKKVEPEAEKTPDASPQSGKGMERKAAPALAPPAGDGKSYNFV